MPITIETVKSKGRLVADDERYRIYDYRLDDLTISLTELKKGQETRGHSHDSNAEVYIFLGGGNATMTVGDERFQVDGGAVLIPRGEFHRVTNRSKMSDLLFLSIFTGRRTDTRAKYAGGEANLPGRSAEPTAARA